MPTSTWHSRHWSIDCPMYLVMVDPILNHFENSIKNVIQWINNANDILKLFKKCY